jgi:putative Mn2+ efflux pump MntP
MFFIFEESRKKNSSHHTINILNDPERADVDKSGSIELLEALFLTMALSIDTVVAVISIVITGSTELSHSLSFGIIQSVFIISGLFAGQIISKSFFIHKIQFIKASPGYLLIFAGLIRFFLN